MKLPVLSIPKRDHHQNHHGSSAKSLRHGLASATNVLGHVAGNIPKVENQARKASIRHRLIARWRVNKSDWIFTTFVVTLQLLFGSWQCYKYSADSGTREAFGWGLAVAKGSAGALYPTMFFLIISMSRWTVTILRLSPYLSGVINFDKFRSFHIRMAICAFVLAYLHTLGHLSGTFVHGSNAKFRSAVVELLGHRFQTISYAEFIFSLPGWTGIVALVNFTLIVVCSMPMARKWCFELFQYSHFLIYPMIGLLMIHGAANMLQYPVLGFVLALPSAIVLVERLSRLSRMFKGQIADVQPANDEVMQLTFPETKHSRWWSYKVGQYVLVRMPCISAFEWHPFTISRCHDGQFQLYVKKAGEWTKELSRLKGPQVVNVDGPFGAPCQQFYHYDHCIVIATGIGVTPCSAILDDMYRNPNHPWSVHDDASSSNTDHADKNNSSTSLSPLERRVGRTRRLPRFVDFYWSVPGQDMLPWFADTFSRTATSAHNKNIGIRLQVFLTRATQADLDDAACSEKANLSAMFSRDIDAHLHAGRPDYAQLLFEHREKMRFMQHIYRAAPGRRSRKIGVFFCGAPAARDRLKALCYEYTLRGVVDGSGIEYHFHAEVF